MEAEGIHLELYKKAKEFVDKGEDIPVQGYIWICTICGHTYVGQKPPEKCPICGAPSGKYKKY